MALSLGEPANTTAENLDHGCGRTIVDRTLSNRISIDSTYRYIWLEDIQSIDQNIKDKNFNDNGHMITAGLNFHF